MGRWNGKLSTLILTLSLIITAIYFGIDAGETRGQILHNQSRIDRLERGWIEIQDLTERVVRVETMMQATKENTERIERKLDRLMEQQR